MAQQPIRVLEVGGSGGVGCEHMGPVTNVVGQIATQMDTLGLQVGVLDSRNDDTRPRLSPRVKVLQVENKAKDTEKNNYNFQQSAEDTFAGWASDHGVLDQFDIFHVHHPGHVTNFRKVTDKPVVYTCHTPSFWLDTDQYKSAKGAVKYAMLKWQERFGRHDLRAIREADLTVALGHHLAAGVRKLSPGINTSNKISVIANGVAMQDWPQLDRAEARRRLSVDPQQFRLVCVGRIARYKGVHVLLETLQQIRGSMQDIHVDVIGPDQDPLYFTELEALAAGMSVTFHGFVSNRSEQFQQLMCAADISVMPSLQDNQPTVILESLAYGLPVIASRVGASPEMLDDKFGRLFEIGDTGSLGEQILDMYRSRRELAVMRARARAHVEEHYTWEVSTRRYVDEFRKLLAA